MRIDAVSAQPRLSAAPAAPTEEAAPASSGTEPQDRLTLSTASPKTEGLDEEEVALLRAGLLPPEYADLKACLREKGREAAKALAREDKEGPFSPAYGDPDGMLKAARRIQANPELLRMVKDIRKGDMLLQSWNTPGDAIASMTKGPFTHVVMCTQEGPPPDFIEAMGISGSSTDEGANLVRRTSLAENTYEAVTVRLVRPTEGMAEPLRSQLIDRAVRYTERQLGKPYDYAFTNQNGTSGLDDAFYCSELTYLAYVHPAGANMTLPLDKSPERDRLIVAIEAVIVALDPHDKASLMDGAIKFINREPRPSAEDLVDYMVDEVMTRCRTTEGLLETPQERERFKGAIATLMAGKALPEFEGALAAYQKALAAGEYSRPIIGFFRSRAAKLAIAKGLMNDAVGLFKSSGLKPKEALASSLKLIKAFLPHAEVFASYLFGPHHAQTQATTRLLDRIAWLKENLAALPLIDEPDLAFLPTRAQPTVKRDFVSPSDLAWSGLPYRDYNLKPGHSIERPN
jgi:hypothetical protein